MRFVTKMYMVVAACVLGLIILFLYNPEQTLWMPKCPVYVLTGLKCPACGLQRAIHSLFHFKFAQAVRYNFFLVLAIPYAVSLVIVTWLDTKNKLTRLRQLCYSHVTIYIYLFCFVAWWIVRNILDI